MSDVDINETSELNLDENLDLDEDLDEATGDVELSDLDIETDEEFIEDDDADEDDSDERSPIKRLINKLKSKIASMKKKSSGDDDDDDDDDEGQTKTEVDPDAIANLSGKDKIQAIIAAKVPALKGLLDKLKKKNSDDDDDDDDFDPDYVTPMTYASDEEESPKRKLKLIHIILILIVVGALFYEDIVPPDEVAVTPTTKKKIKKKRPVKKAIVKKEVLEKPVVKQPVEVVPAAIGRTAEQIKELGTTSKDDLISDTDLDVGTGNKAETKPKVTEKKDTKKEEEDIDDLDDLFDEKPLDTPEVAKKKNIEASKIAKAKAKTSDEIDAFNDLDTSSDDLLDIGEMTGQKNSGLTLGDGVIDDQVVDSTVDQSIARSILADLEIKVQKDKKQKLIQRNLKPVDPPTYEITGRSLVYNCSDKHWACIDSISYKTCEKNYAWMSDQGKEIECYPVDVYPSEEKCGVVQQHKIDNIAETLFCGF